jgi:uncharacterized membrane protein YvbJ
MFCHKCGAENPEGVNFCYRCGISLSQIQATNKIEQKRAPDQPIKTGDATLAFTDSCTKGCGNPIRLFIEVIIAIIVTVIVNALFFWIILGGDFNSPLAVISPIVLFIAFFIGIHRKMNG